MAARVTAGARLSPADLSSFLLDLHERSNELGYRELQNDALRRLTELIHFDAGLMGMGTIRAGVPHGHDVVLHECPPALMESWELVKHEDKVAMWAFHHPGETGSFAVDGPIFDGCDAARAHCRAWRIAHVMCTSMISAEAGLCWVMSVYRADAARPFTEVEREAMQLVVPHLMAAARRARIGQRCSTDSGGVAGGASREGTAPRVSPVAVGGRGACRAAVVVAGRGAWRSRVWHTSAPGASTWRALVVRGSRRRWACASIPLAMPRNSWGVR